MYLLIIEFQCDTKQIKKMWQNLKTKARDAKTLESQRKRTGGGPAPPDMGSLESQVIAVMPNVLPSIAVEIDSDTLNTDTGELGLDNDEQSWLPKRARVSDDGHIFEIMDINNEIQLPIIQHPITEHRLSREERKEDANRKKKQKTFDEIKKDILFQELQNNKKKFEEEMRREEEKHTEDMDFKKKKHALELEILIIKKEKLQNESLNN